MNDLTMIKRLALILGILTLLVPGMVQASVLADPLDEMGASVTQANGTSILRPTGGLSGASCSGPASDPCETKTAGNCSPDNSNCPYGCDRYCMNCDAFRANCCGGTHHECCRRGAYLDWDPNNQCYYVRCQWMDGEDKT